MIMPVGFVEWTAAVLAVIIIIKAIFFNLNPNKWINFWMKGYRNVTVFRSVYLAVFFILAYYLLQEMSYVRFFAAMMAGMFLYAHTMMHYPDGLKKYVKNFKNRSDLKKLLLDWIIWIALSVLVLRELFF